MSDSLTQELSAIEQTWTVLVTLDLAGQSRVISEIARRYSIQSYRQLPSIPFEGGELRVDPSCIANQTSTPRDENVAIAALVAVFNPLTTAQRTRVLDYVAIHYRERPELLAVVEEERQAAMKPPTLRLRHV
jgi:hypothetical protein